MSKYRLLYIDEDEKDRENLSSELSSDQMEVIAIHPNVVEADLINYILDEKFDAIIVDYTLYGKDASIKYNGAEVVQQIQEIKDKYPAFILTNNRDNEDVGDKIDDNLIFTKTDLKSNPSEIQRRISGTIKHYIRTNTNLEARLVELLKKRNEQGGLDDEDSQELYQVNYEIERRLNKREILPELIKDSDSMKALNQVIKDAQEYLNKVKK